MRILFSISTLLLLIFFGTVQGGLTSCTKDNTIYDTVTVIRKDTITVIQKDTVIIKDTAMSAAILTAHSWKPRELRAVYGGDSIYYWRGGVTNSFNYDGEYHTFNADGTGFSLDANGYSHIIQDWYFTDTTCTQLKFKYFITNSPIFVNMTWENIRFKNNAIWTDEYWYDNYSIKNYHGQAIRIAK